MITKTDFEKIVEEVEHGVDYEFLLMILVDHHYRRSRKFKDQDKTNLATSEADKAELIIDYMEAFHKFNRMMEDE